MAWGSRFMAMDTTQLQWLLVGIGVAVVILGFLWTIRSRIREGIRRRRRRPEREPMLGEAASSLVDSEMRAHDFGDLGFLTPDHHLADKALVDVEIRRIHRETASPLTTDDVEPEPLPSSFVDIQTPPGMTVILTVVAPRHLPFSGFRIQTVAEELNFRLNSQGLFDRFPDEEEGTTTDTPIFSVAHLREPGTFDPMTLHELKTSGLLLFMNLPGPMEGTKALDLLVLAADQWAQKLGGVICDERRYRMSNRALMHLRSQISDLERQLQAWALPY